MRSLRSTLLALLAFAAGARAPAQPGTGDTEPPDLQALQEFTAWLGDYRVGAIRLMHDLQLDRAEYERAERVMATLAAWNNTAAAERLFEAAIINPEPPGAHSATDQIDFQAELQPWKIREIARRMIAKITDPAIDDWLISHLRSRNLRGAKEHPDRAKAEAAIQILGLRSGTGAKLALLEASTALPPRLRLRAVDVLSSVAGIELIDHFLALLRDREPDMRIAALNAIGTALGPHTDETEHESIPPEVAKLRDTALEQMRLLLLRDRIWQVRAACAHNVAQLKSKHSIPVLIEGLEAELERTKDPWAMDMRLHRLLERMTGVSIPAGDSKPWEMFWRDEKDRLRLTKPSDAARKNAEANRGRYAKFFSLDLESDKLLFIVDFSGSMDETIVLKTETTSARPGDPTTKARLVVDQIKKIVLSLPDRSLFNIIVFSDDVRVWRPNRFGGPAMVELTEETRDDLLGNFLDSLVPQGATNLYGALDRALDFAGPGIKDAHYAVDYDTIYILSDGAPTWGEVTDKVEIRRRVREANRLKRITIHAVTFGELNDVEFLRDLAEENGGRHIHVE